MTQKVLRDFSGGLSRQIAPHLIEDNQGTTYINIDNSRGTLMPIAKSGPLQDLMIQDFLSTLTLLRSGKASLALMSVLTM